MSGFAKKWDDNTGMSDDPNMQPKKIAGIENRRRRRRDGSVYWTFRVRWTDPATKTRVGEEFDRQADAIDFQATLRLAKRGGALADLTAGRESLAEFAAHWWETYAATALQRATLTSYSVVWNLHVLPRIGHLQLRAVTPGVIARLRTDLEQAAVGAPTVRKAMSMLQAILRRAVEEDRLRSNPALHVRKPGAARTRAVQPLPPTAVEALRAHVQAWDATLLSVLAYAGLRPEEALALEWRHVRQGTLLVEQKNVDGQLLPGQKVDGKPPRTVDLLAALRADLTQHRLATGRPSDLTLVFPRPDGRPWREHDWRNWRRRTFQPAIAAAQLGTLDRTIDRVPDAEGVRRKRERSSYQGPRPYDLRHSFASLLIHEGRLSVVEIANQLGHSTETLLRVYTHVFAELRGAPKIPADQQIANARAERQREAM